MPTFVALDLPMLVVYENDRESVVTLAAYGLDRRCGHPSIRGEQVVESPHAHYARIVAVGVNDCSVPHDVVNDNQTSGAREFHRPPVVIRYVRLVGVDEDQIEWAFSLRRQRRKRVESEAQAQLNSIGQPRQ